MGRPRTLPQEPTDEQLAGLDYDRRTPLVKKERVRTGKRPVRDPSDPATHERSRARRAAIMADEEFQLAICHQLATKRGGDDTVKLRAVALAHKITSTRRHADMMQLLIRVTDEVRRLVARGYDPESVLSGVAEKLECVPPIYRTFILQMAKVAAQEARPALLSSSTTTSTPPSPE
jgi:hypothetical protein